MRALLGQEVSAMMIMTFSMLLPNMATTMRMRKKEGIIKKMLVTSVSILSAMPPKNPATAPRRTPITPESAAATMPIFRDVLPPYRIMLSTSSPI